MIYSTFRNPAIALLASCAIFMVGCSMPASNDGQSRMLTVNNATTDQTIIGLFAGKPGTTPYSKGFLLEALPSDGQLDYLPFSSSIRPGQTKVFNVDDGLGTCVFEIAVNTASGGLSASEYDVCKLNRENKMMVFK